MEPVTEQDTGAEIRLWQAVIVQAIEEWVSGPLRQKRQAEHYLFDDNTDFRLVCQSAGMDADYLRTRLAKMKPKYQDAPEAHVLAA